MAFPEDKNRDVTCFIWNVNQRYYHMESAQIRIELETTVDDCDNATDIPSLWWLNVLIILGSMVSFSLELHHLLETVRIIGKLRRTFGYSALVPAGAEAGTRQTNNNKK